jgi:hypothetical protein
VIFFYFIPSLGVLASQGIIYRILVVHIYTLLGIS